MLTSHCIGKVFQEKISSEKKKSEFERGDIVVNTEIRDQPDGRVLLMVIMGQIPVQQKFIREHILDFEKYPAFFDFLRRCSNDSEQGLLKVEASILIHRFFSLISYETNEECLNFNILEGTMHGCFGSVEFVGTSPDNTTIIICGQIKREKFPVPDFLIYWGAQRLLRRGTYNFKKWVVAQWLKEQGL